MASTLLLDTVQWDLVTDSYGNIAVAKEPYALAQDSASSIKLFQGELWYDTSQGVPYWEQVLGQAPPLILMKTLFNEAALSVPGVKGAQSFIRSVAGRKVTGQVQTKDTTGRLTALNF